MAELRESTPLKEIAYYYPDPMWASGDWVKNLILFFDGIALLLPRVAQLTDGCS